MENAMAGLSLLDGPADTRRWKPFKLISDDGRIPPALMDLFRAQYLDDSLSRFGYVATLANLAMVESGFVPTHGDDPDFPAEELMLDLKERRMNRFIDILTAVARDKRTLKEVYYKYMKRVNPETLSEDPHYIYGPGLLKLTVWHNADTYVTLEGAGHRKTFQLHVLANYISTISNWERLRLSNMMRRFSGVRFMADVKVEICTYFIDTLDSYAAEPIGFKMLPNELVQHFAQYLDLRSFVSLLMTCRRARDVLDSEPLWRNLLNRIPSDFAEYNLPVPAPEILRARIAEPGIDSKEKYRRLYLEAEEELRRIRARNRQPLPRRMFPLGGLL